MSFFASFGRRDFYFFLLLSFFSSGCSERIWIVAMTS